MTGATRQRSGVRRPRSEIQGLALAVILLAGAFAAPPALGQGLADVCRPLEHPVEGSWARYRLRSGPGDSAEVRMAVVGHERIGDQDYFWQESIMSAAAGETVIQSLVPAAPYDPTAIRRAVVRLPGQDAMELPPAALAMLKQASGQGPAALDACRHGEGLGWETIDVPAGRVRALRVRYTREGRTAETWLAPGIPFAVTRTIVTGDSAAQRLELELVGHGRHAVPTIPLGQPANR
ncbi:MAG: hypothetical protein Q8W45_10435 [Candidatus Palauibacterales bacterium]|nr:hypothetical protein [Candidatus Palauibacterales bacterium]